MDRRHKDFLASLGCMQTRHSGRTLFEHLKGVHDLLRDWDNDQDVCNAGLFHSIYGTKAFKHRSTDDRGKVIEQIGLYAEAMVLMFSAGQRPFFTDITDENLRSNLMEIEAANLIEQGGGREQTLHKLATQKISAGAKAALWWELALR